MSILNCNAMSCVNNISGLCSANTIVIQGNKAIAPSGTECKTFAEKGLRNAVMNLGNMNLTGELRQAFTNRSIEMSPNIKCEAENCIYNRERFCNASNVQIYGADATTSENTRCKTFVEK